MNFHAPQQQKSTYHTRQSQQSVCNDSELPFPANTRLWLQLNYLIRTNGTRRSAITKMFTSFNVIRFHIDIDRLVIVSLKFHDRGTVSVFDEDIIDKIQSECCDQERFYPIECFNTLLYRMSECQDGNQPFTGYCKVVYVRPSRF